MALCNPLYWRESLYNPQEIKKINTLLKRDLISTRAQQGADGVIKTSKVKGVPWKKDKPYLKKFYVFFYEFYSTFYINLILL